MSAPQRNATSFSTSILPSQMISPSGSDGFGAGAESHAASRGLDHRVGATAAALPLGDRYRVVGARVDAAGRAHPLRQAELGVVEIDRDDPGCAGKTRSLHRGKSDRAASDHHDYVGATDAGDVQRRADPGHDPAADKAGAVEWNVLRNRHRLLLLDDAVFSERAEKHQVLELAAIRQTRLAVAVELHRLRSLREIVLAQDGRARGRNRSNGRNAGSRTGSHDRPCGPWSTAGPTSSMTPAASWPSTIGMG